MAVAATHLADKSALARHHHPAVATRIDAMLTRGLLASCSIVDLEMLFSARSPAQHRELRYERSTIYERAPIGQPVLDRAEDVQALLAERGQHRAVGVADLVIAAAAESAGLTVLHYDAHFDALAAVTGQPVEWVVPPGSVP